VNRKHPDYENKPFVMKTFIQTSLVLAGLALTAFNSAADTRVWTNVVGNANWSNAANWSNGVPVDGDSVVLLRHPTSSFVNAVNDLTNLTLASIRCESLGYDLGGNKLFLAGDITVGGPAAFANLNISAPLEILGPATQILNTNSANFGWSGLVTAPTGAVVIVRVGNSPKRCRLCRTTEAGSVGRLRPAAFQSREQQSH